MNALSGLEMRVVHLVTEGHGRLNIAKIMRVSHHSVDAYCKSILAKTGYGKAQYWKLRKDIVVIDSENNKG